MTISFIFFVAQLEAIGDPLSKSTKAEAVVSPELYLSCVLAAEEGGDRGRSLEHLDACSKLHRNGGALAQKKQKYQRKQLNYAA